jgi:hypothetical protein
VSSFFSSFLHVRSKTTKAPPLMSPKVDSMARPL